jgi:hypothetical protein
MSHFRNDDFVYYALKAKPINKKPKKPKTASNIVKTLPSRCDILPHPPRIKNNCLKQVDVVNKPLPLAKVPPKTKSSYLNYQASLIEMQKAVREQEKMYRKYCHLEQRLSDDE